MLRSVEERVAVLDSRASGAAKVSVRVTAHFVRGCVTLLARPAGGAHDDPCWEGGRAAALAAGKTPSAVTLPVGFTTFPGEIFRAPRSWAEAVYPNLVYFNEVDNGHFAAWEEPELFAGELRAAFGSLR